MQVPSSRVSEKNKRVACYWCGRLVKIPIYQTQFTCTGCYESTDLQKNDYPEKPFLTD